jgi:hypothetical protein
MSLISKSARVLANHRAENEVIILQNSERIRDLTCGTSQRLGFLL